MGNAPIAPAAQEHAPAPTAASLGQGYVADGPHCKDAAGPGCFLMEDVRKRLIEDYKFRVIGAEGRWLAAMTRAKIANLIKKDEDLPIILSFMLETLMDQLFTAAKLGMKYLRSKGPAVIRNFRLLPGTNEHEAADAVKGTDEGGLVAKLAGRAKKEATGAIEDELKDASEAKQVKGDYLSFLEQEAGAAWQEQREGPPGRADDAKLIALYHAFSQENTSVEHFEKAIAGIWERYQASPASRIGTTIATPLKYGSTTEHQAMNGVARSLRVVMEVTDDESVEFMYYKLDEHDLKASLGIDGERMDRKRWDGDKEEWQAVKPDISKFERWKPVEPEMQTAAIHLNQQQWGIPYDTKRMSSWAKKPPSSYIPKPVDKPVPAAVASVEPTTKPSTMDETNPLAPGPTFMDLGK